MIKINHFNVTSLALYTVIVEPNPTDIFGIPVADNPTLTLDSPNVLCT